jgi:tetratricopeptide (TPR) repeat protein
MKTCSNEKDDFISFCREALQGQEDLLSLIQEFQGSYSANQAIHWLCRHDFFHGFIENIFKLACIDAMLPCRVLIRDVQKQLVQHKCTSITHVYRSEIMSDGQIQQLKNLNGGIIAMKLFLLTNSDRAKALSYTADCSLSNGDKRILFTIEADPQIENVKPFARIGTIGHNNDPNDVIFMIGSLFRIAEIEDEKDGLINIKLTLCGKDDTNQLIELCNQVQLNHIGENGEADIIRFGQFLFEFGNSFNAKHICESGEKIIQSSLEKLPENDSDRLRCYDALGSIELFKKNFDKSLEWYQKSFNMRKEKFPDNLAEAYQNLAVVYSQKGDYTQALENYQQLSIIWKQSYGDDCFHLIVCYTNIALIYQQQQNPSQALSYYYLTLSIMAKHNYSNEVSEAALYTNLGHVCTALQQYQRALGYYNVSLEIKSKLYLTSNPTVVAAIYKSIAFVYESMNNIQQARTNLEKAVDIYRQLDPPNDSYVTEIEEQIRSLPAVEQS